MGQHLPPDHSKGDDKTIGGWMAVHARPAAFEGSDGLSYSVEIEVDETGDPMEAFAAFFVFVRWSRGEPQVTGPHRERLSGARRDRGGSPRRDRRAPDR